MQHESLPPDQSPWGADLITTTPPPVRNRPMSEVWTVDARREEEGIRLKRLLWVFTVLVIILVAPSFVYRIEYSLTSARERARLDVARANLKDFKLDQISTGYRLLAQTVQPSVVNISTQRGRAEGQGSGVIVDKEGYILTNNHVIEGVETAEIKLSDGRRAPASVIGIDPMTDLAVLKTELKDLVPAEWGDSNELQVGDIVWALGSPFGLEKSITSGILSAKERRGITGTRVIQEFLQTDAAVNPGNSGGPLVNHEGKVVGINTAIIGPSYQGISFSVPSELARASYEQIRDHGYVLRGFLGVSPNEVSDDIARELGLERGEGVLVTSVDHNTPAHEAGLKPFDVILSWNGVEFSDPTLLSRAIAATPIGTEVPVKLVRATRGKPKNLELVVKVAARPESPVESTP
ncbi:S1C family serine protease [Lacipirellula parvula]|uniref:HtrA protease/chaperone protein n=1 Tax=Lacipirellula parvula TaxID=2650471 RepID=A0A5K7X7N9_9BACT|nr:trypsin-like peptidase domain-containing protein [Lacipirellula parvula]BBO32405.1 htrA protease/chaperone protein [Lacipirellula parvula]